MGITNLIDRLEAWFAARPSAQKCAWCKKDASRAPAEGGVRYCSEQCEATADEARAFSF